MRSENDSELLFSDKCYTETLSASLRLETYERIEDNFIGYIGGDGCVEI